MLRTLKEFVDALAPQAPTQQPNCRIELLWHWLVAITFLADTIFSRNIEMLTLIEAACKNGTILDWSRKNDFVAKFKEREERIREIHTREFPTIAPPTFNRFRKQCHIIIEFLKGIINETAVIMVYIM